MDGVSLRDTRFPRNFLLLIFGYPATAFPPEGRGRRPGSYPLGYHTHRRLMTLAAGDGVESPRRPPVWYVSGTHNKSRLETPAQVNTRARLGRGSDGARTGLGRNSGEHILLVGGINKTDNADHRDPSQRRRHPLDVAAWRHGTKPGARAGSGWWSGSPVSLSRRLLGKNFSIERGSFPPGGNFLFFFKYFFSRFLTT